MTCGCEEKALLKTMSRVLGNYPRVQPENRLSPAQDRVSCYRVVGRGNPNRSAQCWRTWTGHAAVGDRRGEEGADWFGAVWCWRRKHKTLLHDAVGLGVPALHAHPAAREPQVTTPVLKLFRQLVQNRSQRLQFDVSSPNGQQGYLQLCAVWLLCELGRIQVIQR
ncbi:uncharacterized protein LOC111060310 isoform X4 [Nilaparvata lugens]|uniref:uncharacterized protein LOC111060310 isoform X3 n=1 Tax=Nilaparvata lugens TaxID=108931 RepID=UPI00193D8C00|nr:uncharacterized protein LOC111060310 isoform X3 [Nilaparvata lugens]XP_039275748.1 uncharacterized protein LOC111060310 isoform X4 [Nilaparvata lugens]